MLIKTEAHVKDKLVKPFFKDLNSWSFMPVSNGMGVMGIMDRVGCIPVVVTQAMVGKRIGLSVNVEAKSPKKAGTCSARQHDQIMKHRAAGGISLVVGNGDDLSVLADILARLVHEENYTPIYPIIRIDKSRK